MAERTIANDIQHGSTQSLLACTSCRRKKLKCDRNIPQCRNCLKVSRTCEYPSTAQKPGPRPGTRRRTGVTTHSNTEDSLQHPVTDASSRLSNVHIAPERTSTTDSMVSASDGGDTRPVREEGRQRQHQLNLSSPQSSAFSAACKAMEMTEPACWEMVDVYFRNMTNFSLFHQPTFREKLNSIGSAKQVQALLTSMRAYSIRFKDGDVLYPGLTASASKLLDQAFILNEECLRECADEQPPLHLLQSFIIATWMLTTVGVRGRAWRMVGQCIRMAYEIRLHELDPGNDRVDSTSAPDVDVDAKSWIATEEKRRAWWAVWESDIFCSTIYRSSTAIDWTRNRTNMESSDEAWFSGTPTRSCWLHVDPNQRWKRLRDCENKSPIAWFAVVNSYKWDGLSISLRESAPTTFSSREDELREFYDTTDDNYKPFLLRKREVIENCLRCALNAMPDDIKFQDGYLPFEASSPMKSPYPSMALFRDQGVYVVNTISQVTQMLLCHTDVRGGNYIAYLGGLARERHPEQRTTTDSPLHSTASVETRRRWQLCLVAADRVASIVRHSAPQHYRLVSPNVGLALWMAAATQVAALTLYRNEIDVDLAQSNLDLLTTTLENLVRFWNIPKALIKSLPLLKQQLLALKPSSQQTPSNNTTKNTNDDDNNTTTAATTTSTNTDNYPSSTNSIPEISSTTVNHSTPATTSDNGQNFNNLTPTSTSQYLPPLNNTSIINSHRNPNQPPPTSTNPTIPSNTNTLYLNHADTNPNTGTDTMEIDFNNVMNTGLEGWEALFSDVGLGFWSDYCQP